MEIYGSVAEIEERFSSNLNFCMQNMPQRMDFNAIEVAEMLDDSDGKNILDWVQDIPEKQYEVEDGVFEDAKKTLENIIATVSVLEDNILEPVIVAQDILETVTKIDNVIQETISENAEKFLPFVKINEISVELVGS